MDKKQSNKYQLLTLIFLVVAIVYVWQVYRAAQIITDNRTGKMLFNGIVAAIALFVSWFYFREAQKHSHKK
ncbi:MULTISPECIES: hypothetical protein [Chitinophagaceae]